MKNLLNFICDALSLIPPTVIVITASLALWSVLIVLTKAIGGIFLS